MPSSSSKRWFLSRARRLDEIEAVHAKVGGTKRGRRYATQQVNHAYAMLLSAEFQGYCRDLHSESVDYLVNRINPVMVRTVLRQEFAFAKKLDSGNPNAGNIGSDFGRLGISFWDDVKKTDRRSERRKQNLERLNLWRNAIAHQDFDPRKLGSENLGLSEIRKWRRSCNGLVLTFDKVMRIHLWVLTLKAPW